jgi:DNA-binding MarR family transcriptional regulator
MKIAAKRVEPRASQKQKLRFWLRMLKVQRYIESIIRRKLAAEFDTTLPRFDVMAALDHYDTGVRMKELSTHIKLSNGNVTTIVDRLVKDGLVIREDDPQDRRVVTVRLSDKGRADFVRMAAAHEGWLDEIFSALSPAEVDGMVAYLDDLGQTIGVPK